MLHGHDIAVRTEFDIKRSLCAVIHRIPLDLGQIFHGLTTVRASGIFPILYPVGKAAHRVYILAGRAVKQGDGRFAQHEGIFSESLIILGPDIALHLFSSVIEFGREDLHAAVQGKAVERGALQESYAIGTAGGRQNTVQPQKLQPVIPAIQHQHIHHPPAVGCSGSANPVFP